MPIHQKRQNVKLDLLGPKESAPLEEVHDEITNILASISKPIDRILASISKPIDRILASVCHPINCIFGEVSDCFGHVTTCQMVAKNHTANTNSAYTDESSTSCCNLSTSAPLSLLLFRMLLLFCL